MAEGEVSNCDHKQMEAFRGALIRSLREIADRLERRETHPVSASFERRPLDEKVEWTNYLGGEHIEEAGLLEQVKVQLTSDTGVDSDNFEKWWKRADES